jgi:hypothetical protein
MPWCVRGSVGAQPSGYAVTRTISDGLGCRAGEPRDMRVPNGFPLGSSPGVPDLPQAGDGRRMLGHRSPVDRRAVGCTAPGRALRSGPLGSGSADLARHHQNLARTAERTRILLGGSLDRLCSVTDEVPVGRHPHIAGPAAVSQPARAHRATTTGVRLVLHEQIPPPAGDGADVSARHRYRQRRSRPHGHLFDHSQTFRH